ncbi:putative 2OG-Fe(II) oxygenase, partial [Roseateles sp.]
AAFPPQRFEAPRPGRLLLFPSYLWHGTLPFEDDAFRLTVAFDVVPA